MPASRSDPARSKAIPAEDKVGELEKHLAEAEAKLAAVQKKLAAAESMGNNLHATLVWQYDSHKEVKFQAQYVRDQYEILQDRYILLLQQIKYIFACMFGACVSQLCHQSTKQELACSNHAIASLSYWSTPQ